MTYFAAYTGLRGEELAWLEVGGIRAGAELHRTSAPR
jgi:hypothetical protein